ncbi:LysR family transcriptional regulator [Mameliella alba]|uniref:LysR family transcriptional regulator n=2 Tax=Mameliella alba TaxID=561184 RepID=UPI00180BEF65|nr:LysR family transcriptional regulator [Mameliella alba]
MIFETQTPASLMIREKINDLIAFTAVAEEPSFTRAAARLNVSQSALNETRDEPTGTLRIVAVEYAIESILWPKLSPVLKKYPSVNVELVMEYEYTDLAQAHCDAGVRYGDQVAERMIAMRIGPDERMICIGAPPISRPVACRTSPES